MDKEALQIDHCSSSLCPPHYSAQRIFSNISTTSSKVFWTNRERVRPLQLNHMLRCSQLTSEISGPKRRKQNVTNNSDGVDIITEEADRSLPKLL